MKKLEQRNELADSFSFALSTATIIVSFGPFISKYYLWICCILFACIMVSVNIYVKYQNKYQQSNIDNINKSKQKSSTPRLKKGEKCTKSERFKKAIGLSPSSSPGKKRFSLIPSNVRIKTASDTDNDSDRPNTPLLSPARSIKHRNTVCSELLAVQLDKANEKESLSYRKRTATIHLLPFKQDTHDG